MYAHSTKIRVRYSETDKMGYCYYGNYAAYLEVARVETIRSLGTSYKEMEDEGIILPVVDFHIKYVKPAYYDDEIEIVTYIKESPTAKITFEYDVKKDDEIISTASTVLVFVDSKTGRPMKCPENLLNALQISL